MKRDWNVIILLLLAVMAGCRRGDGKAAQSPDSSATQYQAEPDIELEAEAWADSVLSGMESRRLVGELFWPALYSSDDSLNLRKVEMYGEKLGVGGVVLLKGDESGACRISERLGRIAGMTPFVAIDAEWGLGMRLQGEDIYPKNGNLPESTSEEDMYQYGLEVGRRASSIGINVVLGPVLDLADRGSFIGKRSFGKDAEKAASLGVAYARGLEDGGVMSVAKHFPGHGGVSADSHRELPVINKEFKLLWSEDLYPFRKYIESGLSAVMVGHLDVVELDSTHVPACVSEEIVGKLLKKQMGFKGIVVSDAINMKGASGYGAVAALKAGVDVIIAPVDTEYEINQVVASMEKGELPETEIRSKVKKLLVQKYILGFRRAPRHYRSKTRE